VIKCMGRPLGGPQSTLVVGTLVSDFYELHALQKLSLLNGSVWVKRFCLQTAIMRRDARLRRVPFGLQSSV